MGEKVVDADCRFTLPELAVAVVAVSKIELISSTVLEASFAVLAFSVALSCFSLACLISSLAASILSSGLAVDPGDEVVEAGPASHSSPMVAAPEVTDLKQYSLLAGAPSLQYHCQQCTDHNANTDETRGIDILSVNTSVKTILIFNISAVSFEVINAIQFLRGDIADSFLLAAISGWCRLAPYRGDEEEDSRDLQHCDSGSQLPHQASPDDNIRIITSQMYKTIVLIA